MRVLAASDIESCIAAIDIEDEQPSGKGMELWTDHSYFIGDLNDGEKSGQGFYFFSDASTYSGQWVDDEMSGYGVLK